MAGQGWQEFVVFLYIFGLGLVLFLGFRLFLRVSRREQADLDRDQAELMARVEEEALTDLAIARRAEAATMSQPGDAPSAPSQTERTHR